LAAPNPREKTGEGQMIDIGLMDCQVALLIYRAQYYWIAGEIAEPLGNVHRVIAPTASFQTKDSYIVIDAGQDKFFYQLCDAMGLPELAHDPRFEHRAERLANKDELMATLQRTFLTKSTDEWLEILLRHGIPAGPVNTLDRVLADPQVRERGMVAWDGERELLGNPVKTGVPDTFVPAPELGEHDAEVLGPLRARLGAEA
jgi:CoA:oxalate CoA-transferase